MTTAPILETRQLTRTLRSGDRQITVLDQVNVSIETGEWVAIRGPSGSGKSTLLNILGGLDVPTTGSVTFQDHDLTSSQDTELTRFRREHVVPP